jgi:hypothetical protein
MKLVSVLLQALPLLTAISHGPKEHPRKYAFNISVSFVTVGDLMWNLYKMTPSSVQFD